MQKDHPETSNTKRFERIRNASTPELVRRNTTDSITNVRSRRATIAPSEFALPHNPIGKKLALDRTSIFSVSSSLDRTQMEDTECDTELKFLYDEYLQKIMAEIILKKTAKQKEELVISQLASIAKECDQNEEKFFKLKTRERDIINLTKIQNYIDAQITSTNKFNKEDIKVLGHKLSQLYNLLQPLDVLCCNNIVLPDTPEEWEETNKTLKSCSETLKSITNLIGIINEPYQSVNNGIKEFVDTFNNIIDHQKRLKKELCNLQAVVLKTASLSVMQSHN